MKNDNRHAQLKAKQIYTEDLIRFWSKKKYFAWIINCYNDSCKITQKSKHAQKTKIIRYYYNFEWTLHW